MWLLVPLSLEKFTSDSAVCTVPSPALLVQTRAFGSSSSALQPPLTNNCCFSEHHQELYSLLERDFTGASKEESSNYASALHLGRKALTSWHMVRYWKQFPANTNF